MKINLIVYLIIKIKLIRIKKNKDNILTNKNPLILLALHHLYNLIMNWIMIQILVIILIMIYNSKNNNKIVNNYNQIQFKALIFNNQIVNK